MKEIGKCFECESTVELHNHHVVPRSLGGVKTIKLCKFCHGKIHGIDFTNHGILIKMALQVKKEEGVILGRPIGSGKLDNLDLLKKHTDIHSCLLNKMSIRKIAKHVGCGRSTVQRVKEALNNA